MDVSQQSLKGAAKVGLGAMLALFVMSIIFYKERILFSDSAFYTFNMINGKAFSIEHNRYGSFITQVLPWIAVKANLSLRTILICYSVSFYLFFTCAAFVVVYMCKQYGLALLMILYYFLFVSESYIYDSETMQAATWMFLLFAVTARLGHRKATVPLLLIPFAVLAFLTFSTHFIVIIPTLFLWIYFILEKRNWPFTNRISILLSCALFGVIGLKFLMPSSSYDSEHLRGITHFSLQDILNSFTCPEVKVFLSRCLTNYWPGTLIFIVGMAQLIIEKRKILALWTLISVVGYIILMGLTYGGLDGTTLLFHIESEWSCIGIIAATPFVFAFLPRIKSSIAVGLVAGIFVIRLAYIISFLPPFTARINMSEQILTQMRKKGIKKLALYNDAHLLSVSKLYWGLPFESMMLSSMKGDKPQLTFLFVNPDDKRVLELLKNPALFYDAFSGSPCNLLNNEYFQVDATQPYQVMTYAELLK